MAGAYSVTLFRPFVLPSFRPSVIPDSVSAHYLSHTWRFSNEVCHENTQVEFEFGSGRIIFGGVMPLGLRKIPLIFQFPLIISITNWHFWIEIPDVDVWGEYASWVRIWVGSNNFWESYDPSTLKNSINFQFPLIISIANWHFELKFPI